MLGLGAQEILCLLFVGVLAVALVVLLGITSRRSGRTTELEEENRRLRDENDRLRGRPD